MKTTNNTKQLKTKNQEISIISGGLSELIERCIKSFDRLSPRAIDDEKIKGEGIYALYYTGELPLYKEYQNLNAEKLKAPIYIGTALNKQKTKGNSFEEKIKEQYRNIAKVSNLNPGDFYVKAMPVDSSFPSIAEAIESALVSHYKPLWNSGLEGFASHNPGKGRTKQAPSDWDVIHPGREWVTKLSGVPNDRRKITRRVQKHMEALKETPLETQGQ